MEDLCIVCAEPLHYTAYAECGHKDACSKCVLRLRTVLKDQRCVYCQVPADSVFVTRFMGDYTETVPPDEFAGLPVSGGGRWWRWRLFLGRAELRECWDADGLLLMDGC